MYSANCVLYVQISKPMAHGNVITLVDYSELNLQLIVQVIASKGFPRTVIGNTVFVSTPTTQDAEDLAISLTALHLRFTILYVDDFIGSFFDGTAARPIIQTIRNYFN
jgi:hypothetical protein